MTCEPMPVMQEKLRRGRLGSSDGRSGRHSGPCRETAGGSERPSGRIQRKLGWTHCSASLQRAPNQSPALGDSGKKRPWPGVSFLILEPLNLHRHQVVSPSCCCSPRDGVGFCILRVRAHPDLVAGRVLPSAEPSTPLPYHPPVTAHDLEEAASLSLLTRSVPHIAAEPTRAPNSRT